MCKMLEIFLVQTLIALIVVFSSASQFHIQLILILRVSVYSSGVYFFILIRVSMAESLVRSAISTWSTFLTQFSHILVCEASVSDDK